MPPRYRRARRPPGPVAPWMSPPSPICHSEPSPSPFPRPRRRRASRFAGRSSSWRGVREQCRREEEATHLSKTPPATPRRAKTRLLHPRRSAPIPRSQPCHVGPPSTISRLANRRSPSASRLAVRCARSSAPASPRCRPEHPPAPGNRRGDSQRRDDERHHAPRCRGAAPGVQRRRRPAPSVIWRQPPPGVGACTVTPRPTVSAGATASIPLPEGSPAIVTRSGRGGGRRAAARAAGPRRR